MAIDDSAPKGSGVVAERRDNGALQMAEYRVGGAPRLQSNEGTGAERGSDWDTERDSDWGHGLEHHMEYREGHREKYRLFVLYAAPLCASPAVWLSMHMDCAGM